ncbi:hypothetical protein [Arthrobacter zhaoguopingii]|uniref:hypothetical protein n=1 Tax=Arthrobacter zhaoguopingii TaxID=2681491 RepID=UPI001357DBC1|nr:hypothetical protein [Arthrobacter zhaoguopingii]
MPLESSCVAVLEPDGGLVIEALEFLEAVEEMNDETVEGANDIYTRIGDVEQTAKAELAAPLDEMQLPLREFVQASQSGDTWHLDAEAFKDGAREVAETCRGHLPTEVVAEPEPAEASFEITGDYAADLAAQGMAPDSAEGSAQGFRDFMARKVCERAVDAPAPLTWERDITLIRGQPQITDDILRLTAAYDCPERSGDLEELLGRLPADS